jgi:hypothetical protein
METKGIAFYSVIAGLVVISFLVGMWVGNSFGAKDGLAKGYAKGASDKDAEWVKKVQEVYNVAPEPSEIFSYTGIVESVAGDSFKLKITISRRHPFENETVIIKTVKPTANTRILQQIQKSQDQIDKELETARKTKTPAPLPFYNKIISLSDVQANAMVTVTSNQNMKNVAEITPDTVLLIK